MILADHIVVERGGKNILNDVSLALSPGRVTALVGPNGAGKSTLLHVMAGDIAVQSGTVSIDGTRVNRLGAKQLALRRSVLTQQSLLDFPFSAEEVVVLGRSASARGWSDSEEDYRAARRAMAALDIADKAHQLYPSLSGGEMQRVHVARALVQLEAATNRDNRYLLLDEPTASLDVAHAHLTLKLARDAARQGAGVLVVLHDLQLAAFYADDAVIMKRGKIVAAGPFDQVVTADLVARVFDVSAVAIASPHLGGRSIVVSLPRHE